MLTALASPTDRRWLTDKMKPVTAAAVRPRSSPGVPAGTCATNLPATSA